jgi:hypothetical protein
VIPSERCGQQPLYLVANFLSPQSYSPSAAGSFQGLSSPPVESLWKPYQRKAEALKSEMPRPKLLPVDFRSQAVSMTQTN